MYAGYLDLTQPLYLVVDDILTPAECEAYCARFTRETPEIAPVIGIHGEEIDLDVRNNTRVMWDDADEARTLFERIAPHAPNALREMHLAGANPRLRLYRYGPGEKHGAHWDTEVEFPNGARTLLTFIVYLNDDFDGGVTEFPELHADVQPKRGRALLFQHRVLHIAGEVNSGAKFVLRTDLIYAPPPSR
jgi:prolyl 4-hydroxylase